MSPSEFIPVAEETGLIVPLTCFMLREACRQGAAWQRMFERPLGLSVNISSRLFGREDFVHQIERAIADSALQQGTLQLEITESTLLNSADTVQENFERLRANGVSMYLDDFGTGYSSLSYLQRYPVDALKLDQIVRRANGNPQYEFGGGRRDRQPGPVARHGTHRRGRREPAAHADHLIALGCPHAQGYLFSEAQSSADTEAAAGRGVLRRAEAGAYSVRSLTRRTA